MKPFNSYTLTIGATAVNLATVIRAREETLGVVDDAKLVPGQRCYWQFYADSDNAGIIAIGGTTVDPTVGQIDGLPLSAGADEMFPASTPGKDIWVKASEADQVLSVLFWIAP